MARSYYISANGNPNIPDIVVTKDDIGNTIAVHRAKDGSPVLFGVGPPDESLNTIDALAGEEYLDTSSGIFYFNNPEPL